MQCFVLRSAHRNCDFTVWHQKHSCQLNMVTQTWLQIVPISQHSLKQPVTGCSSAAIRDPPHPLMGKVSTLREEVERWRPSLSNGSDNLLSDDIHLNSWATCCHLHPEHVSALLPPVPHHFCAPSQEADPVKGADVKVTKFISVRRQEVHLWPLWSNMFLSHH